jgi:hypothetical protein
VESRVLKLYAEDLADEYKNNGKLATQAAINNMRYAKGVAALSEALEDNLAELENWRKTGELTARGAEALNETIEALTQLFGLEVSAEFVKKYLEDIKKLTLGGEEAVAALKDLEALAAKDYIMHLDVLSGDYKTVLANMIDYLNGAEIPSLEVGMEADISGFTDTLEEILNAGLMTKDELENVFNSFGWSPEITSE